MYDLSHELNSKSEPGKPWKSGAILISNPALISVVQSLEFVRAPGKNTRGSEDNFNRGIQRVENPFCKSFIVWDTNYVI